MEYLEKILYSLLIYLIPSLFFIFGLLLAYLMWYRHSRRLNMLVTENRELQRSIKALDTEDLKVRFHGKVNEKVQSVNDAWHHSHSTQEQHLKESLRHMESQNIQIQTAQTELKVKTQQLRDLDEAFTNYKYDQEVLYDTLLQEKNTLINAQGLGGGHAEELEKQVKDLQTANAGLIVEKNQKDQKISEQEAKIKELEAKLIAAPVIEKTSISKPKSTTSKKPADYFINTQAHNHYRYGYIYDNVHKAAYSDNLAEIKGVNDSLNDKLNSLGIYQFKQVALWNKHQVDAFQHDIGSEGSINIVDWVNQASELHYKSHGDVITSVLTTSQEQNKISSISQSIVLKSFEGEDVRVDDDLGVVYNSRPEEVDDLKLIRGVADVLEEKLHNIGIYRFRQIANWEIKQMTEFSNKLDFPGRIERDDWKLQARRFHLAKYGEVIA